MTPDTRHALGLPALPADQARRIEQQGDDLRAGRYARWPAGLNPARSGNQLPTLTPRAADELAERINHLNAKRTARAEAAAHVVLFVVFCILGTCALVHYLTPCEAGQLCLAAVVTPTRTGWLGRLFNRLRAAYLRNRIAWAEADLDCMQHTYESLPSQMNAHRIWLDHRRVELIGLELTTRKN